MSHVLAPTGEDPVGKVVIEGEWIIAATGNAIHSVFEGKRGSMNKERLEWVMSGLSQYKLTENENQFIKSASGDFGQKQMLTERQEQRLENLYKEKSKSKPNKNSPGYFSFRESLPQKARVRKPFAKDVLITT